MDIIHTLNNSSSDDFKSEKDRDEAIKAAKTFLARVEDPFSRLWSMAIDSPALLAAIKICLDINLFEKWNAAGDGSKSYLELADMCNVPPNTLRRLLRHLGSNSVLREVDPERYEQTAHSQSLLDPARSCWVQYYYDACGPLYLSLPEYLRRNNYSAPTDPKDGVFQVTFDCKGEGLFDWYADHPAESKTFNDCMTGGHMAQGKPWVDVYPTDEIMDGSTEEGSLLVDIGGNIGQELDQFLGKHPATGSRLVLQDLPNVVERAVCDSTIEKIAYDFFTPQPIKDARAYYMHGIIHDWSDEHSRKILTNVKDAMKSGYSKLLINEFVMPSFQPPSRATGLDLQMMVKVASAERTADMFRELLESVGLRMVKVWEHPESFPSIIEAELPASA